MRRGGTLGDDEAIGYQGLNVKSNPFSTPMPIQNLKALRTIQYNHVRLSIILGWENSYCRTKWSERQIHLMRHY